MANEKHLIDFELARKAVMEILAGKVSTHVAVKVAAAMQDAAVDAVPAEKYNALKERYERMKENADILDTALRQYQRQYGE